MQCNIVTHTDATGLNKNQLKVQTFAASKSWKESQRIQTRNSSFVQLLSYLLVNTKEFSLKTFSNLD